MPVFQPRAALALALVFLASVAALASALAAQFVFGIPPCVLCIWQRVPYALAGLVALVGLVAAARRPNLAPLFLGFCLVLFVAEFGLAFFHFGVEQHWWAFAEGCTVAPLTAATPEEVLAQILATPQVPCDVPGWMLLGLSVTFWNALFAAGLSLLTGFFLLGSRFGKRP